MPDSREQHQSKISDEIYLRKSTAILQRTNHVVCVKKIRTKYIVRIFPFFFQLFRASEQPLVKMEGSVVRFCSQVAGTPVRVVH